MANPATSDGDRRQTATDTAQDNKSSSENIAPVARSARTDQTEIATKNTARSVNDVASAQGGPAGESRDDSLKSPPFKQRPTNFVDVSFKNRNKRYFKLPPYIRSFVRRHPFVSLGGVAILGFAASRFAKAADHLKNQTLQSPDTQLRHSPYNTPHPGTYRTPLSALHEKQETR